MILSLISFCQRQRKDRNQRLLFSSFRKRVGTVRRFFIGELKNKDTVNQLTSRTLCLYYSL